MTRHGRNATNSAVYSYHEKQKDSHASGYGSKMLRLSKDSVKDFDCCSLSLQPCKNPVCTLDGWLYEKEVILEYLLAKQKEYDSRVRRYENWLAAESRKAESKKEMDEAKKRHAFERRETQITSSQSTHNHLKRKSASSLSQMDRQSTTAERQTAAKTNNSEKHLPSFWLPSQTPDVKHGDDFSAQISDSTGANRITSADNERTLTQAAENANALMHRPNKKTIICCPMSKKHLRLKDLVNVKFCQASSNVSRVGGDRNDKYKCPITSDIFRNSSTLYAIKTTGEIVSEECVNRIIRAGGMQHPVSGAQLKESDLIRLQGGGTGFAATNDQLTSKRYGSSMAVA